MKRTVLCIENGNDSMKETIAYLQDNDCRVIALTDMEAQALETAMDKIAKEEGKLDMLLLGATQKVPRDGVIGSGHDTQKLLTFLDEQINGFRAVIDAAIPLLRKGEMKRICMITKPDSSIRLCNAKEQYGENMMLAGLNMTGKLYFNLLRPEGFTFRWYCATDKKGGMSPGEYFLTGLCFDEKEPYQHSDENRFVMRDGFLQEIPW